MNTTPVHRAISQYQIPGTLEEVKPFQVGHINETIVSKFKVDGAYRRYLHQRINSYVFRDTPGLMGNVDKALTQMRKVRGANSREVLTLLKTISGETYVDLGIDGFWRTYEFLEGTVSFEVCTEERQAFEAARVMGRFLSALSECNPADYIETIPLFQDVPNRLAALEESVTKDEKGRAKDALPEIEFIRSRHLQAHHTEELLGAGKIPLRVTHSDPKFNNILFEATEGGYGQGLAVVDLDTIMPGTSLYDFGDLARSVVVSAREDELDLDKVKLNASFFRALVAGYLQEAGDLLTSDEIDSLAIAPRIIALSLGSRFLADYLIGDKYFKIHRPHHNLERARTQLRIVAETEREEAGMQRVVSEALLKCKKRK